VLSLPEALPRNLGDRSVFACAQSGIHTYVRKVCACGTFIGAYTHRWKRRDVAEKQRGRERSGMESVRTRKLVRYERA